MLKKITCFWNDVRAGNNIKKADRAKDERTRRYYTKRALHYLQPPK